MELNENFLKKFQELFEENPAGLIVTDFEGRLLMLNRAARDRLGLSKKTDLSKYTAWEFYPDPREREAFLAELYKKGEVSGYELHLKDFSGKVRTFLVSSRIFKRGDREEIWSTLQDITPLKEAEKALAESEARFRALAENAPLAVIVMDEEGRITYFNPTAERIFGWKASEVLGKELHLILAPPKYHERYLKAFSRVKKTGKSKFVGKRLEFEAQRKDGSIFPVEVFFSVIEIFGERFYLGLVQDISERKRLEEEKLRIEKYRTLELLTGGIAHDFNNFLTSLLGNLDLLERMVKNGNFEKIQEILVRIRKVTEKAQNLARELLFFSRKDVCTPGEIIVHDLLQELVNFLTIGSPVRVHLEIPSHIPPLKIDSAHLSQVMQNLIVNALEAMPRGGELFIRVGRKDNEVVFTVRDTGPGIPEEVISRIFEPGFTTKPKGTGLGLAVVKSIVEHYGGRIEISSRPGEGTEFRIFFPASKEEPPRKDEEKPSQGEGIRFSGRVLVMDDEESIRTLLSEALNYLGMEVETAANGEEALTKYQKALEEGRPFDFLILDLTVPGGKGALWVAENLKERAPNTRLILSTGYIVNEAGKQELSLFDDILYKPYNLKELTKFFKKHLSLEESGDK